MKLNRKLFSALLVIAMMASMLLPVSAAQMEATYGEASYYDIAVEAYSRMLAFHDGVVGAANQNRQYGLITATGEVRVDFQYDGIWYLADNMFSVEQNGRYGIIDTQGNIIKSITHWEITLIRGAYLRIDGDYFTADRNFTPVTYNEAYGYYDDGMDELAKSLGYDWMYQVGMVAMNRYIATKWNSGRTEYLLDGSSNYQVLLTANWIQSWSGNWGCWSVETMRFYTANGIYDGNGTLIYDAAAHGQRIIEENYHRSDTVVVEAISSGLLGLIDMNGNQIIPCEYQRIGDESGEGYIGAVKSNGSGFVDSDIYQPDGTKVKTIANTYVATEVYYRHMAFRTSEDGLNGMMDIDGTVLIPNQYNTIDVVAERWYDDYYNGRSNLLVTKGDPYYGGTYGLYTQEGGVIFDDHYESISYLADKSYKLRDNGRYGVMDTSGRTIIPFNYTDMRVHTTDFIEVYDGRQYKILDLNNSTVVRESNNQIELFRPLSYDLGRELNHVYDRYNGWPGELPFCIYTRDEGFVTVYADPETGTSGGELAHRASGINGDDMFAYQDSKTDLFGFGKLGASEYTYEITSPLGTMDEEIGYYVPDDIRAATVVVDAPVDELAGVYIDGVKLPQDPETGDDYYTVNTTVEAPTSIDICAPYSGAIGFHTLTIEFNADNGGSTALRRVSQNFVTLPDDFVVLPDGYVGVEYSYDFNDSWTNHELYEADEVLRLPDGLILGETTGQITGTPTKAGTWYFNVNASTPGFSGGASSYKITIKGETALPEGVKFVPYQYSFGEAAEVTAGRLPRGLSLDEATGELTGAPLESGSFEFAVRKASSTAVYQMTVADNTNSAVQRPNDYDIIENVGTQDPYDPNSFYKEDYSEETFAINGPYEEFYRLLIDGREKIRDVDYTVREGSTIITVRAQTFRDVGEGTHTIAAEFRGKDSSGKDTMRQAAQNYTLTIRRPSDSGGSGSGSGDSGGSSSPTYSIKVPKIPNCTIKVSPTGASEGTRITLTVRPDTGYVLSNLAVTGPKGKQVPLNQTDDYKYTFRMPNGKVDISVEVEVKQPDPVPAEGTPFLDVKETDWFYHDVAEVYAKGWMVGTSKDSFSPREQISRGMIVTILHRIAGEPAAENTYFADVPLNRYYTAAAAWAVEQGIVTGYGDGHFGPSDPMTREQIIMILYNYANLSGVNTDAQSDLSQFNDLDQLSPDARRAMSWAYSIGLIRGKGDGILDPAGATTRAETAAFLIRFTELTEN